MIGEEMATNTRSGPEKTCTSYRIKVKMSLYILLIYYVSRVVHIIMLHVYLSIFKNVLQVSVKTNISTCKI